MRWPLRNPLGALSLTRAASSAQPPPWVTATPSFWWDFELDAITTSDGKVTASVDRVAGKVLAQGTGDRQPTWAASTSIGKPGALFAGAHLLSLIGDADVNNIANGNDTPFSVMLISDVVVDSGVQRRLFGWQNGVSGAYTGIGQHSATSLSSIKRGSAVVATTGTFVTGFHAIAMDTDDHTVVTDNGVTRIDTSQDVLSIVVDRLQLGGVTAAGDTLANMSNQVVIAAALWNRRIGAAEKAAVGAYYGIAV